MEPEGKAEGLRDAYCTEATLIEHRARLWSHLYRVEAVRWRRLNIGLTVLATTLAAISGGTGLTQVANRTIVAIIALAAAGVTAAAGALGAASRANNATAAASANVSLGDGARVFYSTTGLFAAMDEASRSFQSLCEQRDRVVSTFQGLHLPWKMRKFKELADWAAYRVPGGSRTGHPLPFGNPIEKNDR